MDQLDFLGPLSKARPRDTARRWLATQPPVVSWRGTFLAYDAGRYSPVDIREYREQLDRWLEAQREIVQRGQGTAEIPYRVTKDNSTEVLDAAAGLCLIPDRVELPTWTLPGERELPICLQDGLLYPSIRTVLPHVPQFVGTSKLPFEWGDGTPEDCPKWKEFLAIDWTPAQVEYFQEWCGYLLASHRRFQKFMLIQGPPRSGKGTILDVLTALVGEGNTYPCDLQTFSTKYLDDHFPVAQMIVVADARSSGGKTESGAALEFLLKLVGNDPLRFERKYRNAWSGKPVGKLVIMSNMVPPFQDASGALSARTCLFQRKTSFTGREDTELGKKLAKEIRGIFFWALEGLERLEKRGRFDQSSEPPLLVETFAHTSNPVGQFVAEETRPGGSVLLRHLYERWLLWCRVTGTHNNLRAIQFLTAVLQCGGYEVSGRGRDLEVVGIEMKGAME